MAKVAKGNTRTSLESINDTLSKAEQRLENNKKLIYWVLGILLAVVALVLIYIYAIRNPGIKEANEAIGRADVALYINNNADSALTLYKGVASNYSSYDAGDRACHMAAILLYQKGKYDDALKYLEKGTAKGKIEGPAYKSLQGDCYVNKKQYDKAISCYNDAINMAGDNMSYAPMFMMKKATVQHAIKDYSGELSTYTELKQKYPQWVAGSQTNVDKYIERAKGLAGK